MADLQFGLLKGASVVVPYDQMVNDQARHYQIQKQRSIEQENKAKLFADDFDYTNAINTYDNPLIKENARKQISTIGTFIRDNPGWEKDISKRIQYKSMVKDLKDNPDLNRGLMSDANYNQLQKDLAEKSKNPQLFDRDAYNDQLAQWQNYLTYGNQGGAEALKIEGKKAFVYSQPQDFVDLAASGLEKGNKFNQFKIESLKGGGPGSYQEVPDEKSLDSIATDEYIRNKRQYDKEYTTKGFQTPFEYAKANIRAGVKTKFDYGELDSPLEWEKLAAKGEVKTQPEGVFTKDIVNTQRSIVNGEVLKLAFGAKPSFKVKGNSGRTIDLTGQEVDYTGRNNYIGEGKRNGIKHFEVITQLPMEDAIAFGIVTNNKISDDKVDSDFEKNARIRKIVKKDKEGNDYEVEYVEVYDFVPFDVSRAAATAAGIYDQKATISKYQEAPQNEYGTSQTTTQGQVR